MKIISGPIEAQTVSERIAAATATTTTLAAIPADRRTDGMVAVVLADYSTWVFKGSSSTAAATGYVVAPSAGSGRWHKVSSQVSAAAGARGVSYVRGAVFANVADLAAFTVASNDGLTYVAGERVLLANQTTAAQCGIYVVGTVAGGTAPLTRADDMPSGATIQNGYVVHASEGTLFKGSEWKALCTGAAVIGTNDPVFYPRICQGTLTLASGTKALGATEGLYLVSTTRSSVQLAFNTAGGVKTGTVDYGCAVAGRTAGKSGTAALTVIACVEAGTIQNQDNSTIDWLVTNW